MSEKQELLHTDRVLIVEGKYDAARLSHLTDAMILLTDGFGIYKDKKRQQLFKTLARRNGLILLTDSDAAGFRIRTYITNLVGEKNVVQAYVPAIHGKEKRKAQPGKEGLLGVEGVDDALVLQALRDALGEEADTAPVKPEGRQITYTDLYEWGLSGTAGSAERKMKLLSALGLPPRLSKKELVEALNRLYSYEQLDEMQAELEDKADAKEDVSETETVTMVVTGGTINVRTGPGTNYDKITQVVSGKQVTVVGESNGWYQVTFDSTTGWLLGEYLRDPADLDGTVGAKVVSMAMPFLGTRYRSGGASPNGFDCSGFTMYLYAQLGYSLPHSATAQYKNCGYAVAKSDLQPGDLVFFSDSSHAIGHVGIYIGNGQIIHARYSVGKVMIDSLSASYYASRYVGAKRIA